jgi:uncharacterized protein (DUF2384 family)
MVNDMVKKIRQSESARIRSLVEEVYGSRERARDWLNRPNPHFENNSPNALLSSGTGLKRVEELLIQISEGMFI